ncbi:MAG: rhodanese-like domain-containing protein [Propionibacteriaceae bacterium]|nr:rhodanese-like domain-containing protein [Propionibacteriaceae bacterium]
MKKLLVAGILAMVALAGCTPNTPPEEGTPNANTPSAGSTAPAEPNRHQTITAEEAKEMMDEMDEKDGAAFIILDVRSEQEYVQQHIPGAMLIPDTEILQRAESKIPDKDITIFVYCRSGVRSEKASTDLDHLGYTKVYNMGGIINWPYDTTSG